MKIHLLVSHDGLANRHSPLLLASEFEFDRLGSIGLILV